MRNPYESASPDEQRAFKKIILPLQSGTSFKLSQGAFGPSTHNLPGYEYAWDFDVPYGTPVIAVEDGKVIQVWEPKKGGGCDPQYSDYAHNIKILSSDGTVTQYVHVQSQVRIGDEVLRGQIVALTANNGYICSPQLYFSIFRDQEHLPESGHPQTIPVSFIGLPNSGIAKQGLSTKAPDSEGEVSPTQKTQIPFSYFEKTFVVVPVQINEQLTRNFIIDTGIGVNLISKRLCKELDCKVVGEHSGKRMSGQVVHIPMSKLKSLSLGGHSVKNISVGVLDFETMMPESHIDGFLSLGFFKDSPYTVDNAQNMITFEGESSLKEIRADGFRVPVRLDIQGPSLGAFIPLVLPDGEKISVEVDTGSQALILDEKFMKPLGFTTNDPRLGQKNGQDETGHKYSRFFTHLSGPIHLLGSDSYKMGHPEVMFQKIIYDGLLGHDFLSQFTITYDLKKSEMIFRKSR